LAASASPNVSKAELTELVFGPPRSEVEAKLKLLRMVDRECLSANNKTCSGHGTCALSSPSIFGLGFHNVKKFVCVCDDGWLGRGCHIEISGDKKKKLKRQLKRLLSSSRAGAISSTVQRDDQSLPQPNKEELDAGSVFGRSNPYYQGVKRNVRIPRRRGTIRERYQPASTWLDSWAMPDPASCFLPATTLLARWRKIRKTTRYIPDDYLKRRVPEITFSKTQALYTSAAGRTVKGPLLRKGQRGIPVYVVSPKDNPAVRAPADPTAQKLLDTLNIAVTPKPLGK